MEAELTRSPHVEIKPIIHSEYNIQLDLGSQPITLLSTGGKPTQDNRLPSLTRTLLVFWREQLFLAWDCPTSPKMPGPYAPEPAVTPVIVIIKIFPLKIFLNSPWAVILTPLRITGSMPTQTPALLYTCLWPLFKHIYTWRRGAHLAECLLSL